MKITRLLAPVVLASTLAAPLTYVALRPAHAEQAPAPASEYKVEFDLTADPSLEATTQKLRAVFLEGYPKLIKRFGNPDRPAPKTVPVIFEKNLPHPAHASGGKLTFSVEWFQKNPGDLGVMTHELTHIIQDYRGRNPGWLVEGIADYARALYGPKEDTEWKLPERLTERNSYRQSYRVTAKFLLWLDQKKPGVVDTLHQRMQKGQFRMEAFQELTGQTVDELWAECVASFK